MGVREAFLLKDWSGSRCWHCSGSGAQKYLEFGADDGKMSRSRLVFTSGLRDDEARTE